MRPLATISWTAYLSLPMVAPFAEDLRRALDAAVSTPVHDGPDGTFEKCFEGLRVLTLPAFDGDFLERYTRAHGPVLYISPREKELVDPRIDLEIPENLYRAAQALDATDVHIEPKVDGFRIRFRIDGILHTIRRYRHGCDLLMNRLKIEAGMDSMSREMQDGSMEAGSCTIRASVVPTTHGEKMVLRFLRSTEHAYTAEALGMPDGILQRYLQEIEKPGMHLVCGPTGSGKNTTLHALIQKLPCVTKNVVSIEDPVEYRNDAITQLQVDDAKGRTFQALLRSVLRQDPDILYIGEIRDEETASVAMRAAITGHIVFSTLHTRDFHTCMERLRDLGLSDALIREGVRTVVNQRLVPLLCSDCRETFPAPAHLCASGVRQIYRATGCASCLGGVRGRTAIFDVSVACDGEDGTRTWEKLVDFAESERALLQSGDMAWEASEYI